MADQKTKIIYQRLFDEHLKFIELGKGIDITTGGIKETGVNFKELKDNYNDFSVLITQQTASSFTFLQSREGDIEDLIQDLRKGFESPVVLGGKISEHYSQTYREKFSQSKSYKEQVCSKTKEYYFPLD